MSTGTTALTDPPAPAPAPAPNPAPAPGPAPAPAPEPAPAPAPAPSPSPEPKKDDPPARVVPEKYELKLPEGAEFVSEADLTEFAEEAKALKLTNEEAQKLFESRAKDRSAFMDKQLAQHAERVEGWAAAIKTDEEIAGKDGKEFEANLSRAKLVVAKFGSAALQKALNDSGYGNHPELVRMMVRIGKAMKEDSFHTGDDHGAARKATTTDELAAKLYPTHSK